MSRPEPLRYELEVTPDLLVDNDLAPEPGRVLLRAHCPACNDDRRFGLTLGRFAVEHQHGYAWTVHLIRTTAADPAPTLAAAQ